jgi:hypothetical protein
MAHLAYWYRGKTYVSCPEEWEPGCFSCCCSGTPGSSWRSQLRARKALAVFCGFVLFMLLTWGGCALFVHVMHRDVVWQNEARWTSHLRSVQQFEANVTEIEFDFVRRYEAECLTLRRSSDLSNTCARDADSLRQNATIRRDWVRNNHGVEYDKAIADSRAQVIPYKEVEDTWLQVILAAVLNRDWVVGGVHIFLRMCLSSLALASLAHLGRTYGAWAERRFFFVGLRLYFALWWATLFACVWFLFPSVVQPGVRAIWTDIHGQEIFDKLCAWVEFFFAFLFDYMRKGPSLKP